MSKTKTITPSMVKDWLKDVADPYCILADLLNGKRKSSELKEDISIFVDNERDSR